LIAIPHGGDRIPLEVKNKVDLTEQDIFCDSDTLALSIYDLKDRIAALVTMPIARAILDVNRAPHDLPPDNPDGVLKTVTAQGKSIYKKGEFPEESIIKILFNKYYHPYHNKITSVLMQHNIKLALDCHTMLEYAPPTACNPGQARPLVCLSNGGDEKGRPREKGHLITCPPEWIQKLARSFEHIFASEGIVAINSPFSGGHTSKYHYHNTGVPWIQIELNRKLYLPSDYCDAERMYIKESKVKELRKQIFSVLQDFLQQVI
jgi:N-formylglutamate deformylase